MVDCQDDSDRWALGLGRVKLFFEESKIPFNQISISQQGCNSVFSSGCGELGIKIFGKDQDLNSL